MISNKIINIHENSIKVPVLNRTDSNEWIPTFENFETLIDTPTSYIDVFGSFGKILKNYQKEEINPEIGYYDNDKLMIFFKCLIDFDSIDLINNYFKGKLRACTYPKRYCIYFSTNSKAKAVHSVIIGANTPGYVIHHINEISSDNRRHNLHILPKRVHDSIPKPSMSECQEMFYNHRAYWRRTLENTLLEALNYFNAIISYKAKIDFLIKIATINLNIAKKLLELARFNFNLSCITQAESINRKMNPHLHEDYLDTFELNQVLKLYKKDHPHHLQIRFF